MYIIKENIYTSDNEIFTILNIEYFDQLEEIFKKLIY